MNLPNDLRKSRVAKAQQRKAFSFINKVLRANRSRNFMGKSTALDSLLGKSASADPNEAAGSILSSLGMDYGGKIYDLAVYSDSLLNRLIPPAEAEYQRVVVSGGPRGVDPGILKAIIAALGSTKTASAVIRTPFAMVGPAYAQAPATAAATMAKAVAKPVKPIVPKDNVARQVARTVKAPTAPKAPGTPKLKMAPSLRPGSTNPGVV